MKINLHSPVEEVQIQIIPLIDVIFCVLTFFILAALQFTRQQAINVNIPQAATGTPLQNPQRLIVFVTPDGQYSVNSDLNGKTSAEEQHRVNRPQLAEILQKYHAANPNGQMVLAAAQTAIYNDVVQVLDNMRKVGGDRVALATLPPVDEQPSGNSNLPRVPVTPQTTPVEPLNPPLPEQSLNGQGLAPVNPTGTPLLPAIPTPQPTSTPPK